MMFSFYSISNYLKCDISGTLCWLPSEVSIADLPSTVMSTRELCASCPSPAFNENYTRVVKAAFHVCLPTILSYCAVISKHNRVNSVKNRPKIVLKSSEHRQSSSLNHQKSS